MITIALTRLVVVDLLTIVTLVNQDVQGALKLPIPARADPAWLWVDHVHPTFSSFCSRGKNACEIHRRSGNIFLHQTFAGRLGLSSQFQVIYRMISYVLRRRGWRSCLSCDVALTNAMYLYRQYSVVEEGGWRGNTIGRQDQQKAGVDKDLQKQDRIPHCLGSLFTRNPSDKGQ